MSRTEVQIKLDVAKLILEEANAAYRERISSILPIGCRIKFLNYQDKTDRGVVMGSPSWGDNTIFVKTDDGGCAWIDPGIVLDVLGDNND